MKAKKKKTIYFCQISNNILKVIKQRRGLHKRKFLGFEAATLPPEGDEAACKEKIKNVFKKLEFRNESILLSLPSNYVTCRYLKVPTQEPSEIQKIISLQASVYLPYSTQELITAYQIIATDKEGYAYINVIIVPKELIIRYLNLFKELNPADLSIIWSAYGLCYLFDYLRPQESGSVMVMDINATQAELAITSGHKLLFSRYFKLSLLGSGLESVFIDEINKTIKAYTDEISKEKITKIFVSCALEKFQGLFSILSKKMGLPFEFLVYDERIGLRKNLLQGLLTSEHSFANLLGFGMHEDFEESLDLVPGESKEAVQKNLEYRGRSWSLASLGGILIIFSLAVLKDFDNKTYELQQLKTNLRTIEKEAKSLEGLDRRLRLWEARGEKKELIIDVLYEIHKLMPPAMSLRSFNYEEGKFVVLNGQSQELNLLLLFVSDLEKSSIFKNFNIKIKYATQKTTPAGEIVDFEINCTR